MYFSSKIKISTEPTSISQLPMFLRSHQNKQPCSPLDVTRAAPLSWCCSRYDADSSHHANAWESLASHLHECEHPIPSTRITFQPHLLDIFPLQYILLFSCSRCLNRKVSFMYRLRSSFESPNSQNKQSDSRISCDSLNMTPFTIYIMLQLSSLRIIR